MKTFFKVEKRNLKEIKTKKTASFLSSEVGG
jgi:hypothetical protein